MISLKAKPTAALAASLLAAGIATAASYTQKQDAAPAPAAATTETTTVDTAATLAQLDTLAVKGRAPKTGYSRDQFGPAWSDDVDVAGGHDGCDTRNQILKRDLTDITFKPGTRDCVVLTGSLHDPYTGKQINFTRGKDTSSAIQVDHIVAISDSWQKGAQQLTERERRNLANDPRNLIAADGPANMGKGDSDAATWLPPNKGFRCRYVAMQVEVKAAYNLWVTQAEKDAIARTLHSC